VRRLPGDALDAAELHLAAIGELKDAGGRFAEVERPLALDRLAALREHQRPALARGAGPLQRDPVQPASAPGLDRVEGAIGAHDEDVGAVAAQHHLICPAAEEAAGPVVSRLEAPSHTVTVTLRWKSSSLSRGGRIASSPASSTARAPSRRP
jgi:hypothetical protein